MLCLLNNIIQHKLKTYILGQCQMMVNIIIVLPIKFIRMTKRNKYVVWTHEEENTIIDYVNQRKSGGQSVRW